MSKLSLSEKLSKIQGELNAPKNQTNKFGGYNYRSCEDILEALKPYLDGYGLFLTLTDYIDLIGDRYYVKAIAKLSNGTDHIETIAYAREAEQKKGMDVSQITGAASSYARKYALNGLFCIDDNKDADATNKHEKSKPNQANQETQRRIHVAIKRFEGLGITVPELEQYLKAERRKWAIPELNKLGEYYKKLEE